MAEATNCPDPANPPPPFPITLTPTDASPRFPESRLPNPESPRLMFLFLALCFVGIAIGGICAFVIFWPLSLVHLRERHPSARQALGEGAFLGPSALRWLLSGRYHEVGDRQFTGLATPARVSAIVTLFALGMSGLMLLWAVAFR